MAVRDDFTAGEVLAAADLNDTFAEKLPYAFGTATPSTTDSGFLWYDSNSTPAVAKYWDGSAFTTLAPAPGLELITTETLSAVSSVSINGCFTATYENYLLMVTGTFSSADNIALRLRASGADDTGSNYNEQSLVVSDTSVTGVRVTNSNRTLIGFLGTGTSHAVVNINKPQKAFATSFSTLNSDPDSNARLIVRSGQHALSTAYDGLTLNSATTTPTFTATLRIYGYKD